MYMYVRVCVCVCVYSTVYVPCSVYQGQRGLRDACVCLVTRVVQANGV